FFSSRRRHTRCLSDWSSDVCSSDLVRRAQTIIKEESDSLRQAGRKFGEVPVGAMIEVPSAVFMADKIARIVDFFELGTNDLVQRSEEHTSELQSLRHLVCRLLLEKK